jgi:hypothetical protein
LGTDAIVSVPNPHARDDHACRPRPHANVGAH